MHHYTCRKCLLSCHLCLKGLKKEQRMFIRKNKQVTTTNFAVNILHYIPFTVCRTCLGITEDSMVGSQETCDFDFSTDYVYISFCNSIMQMI